MNTHRIVARQFRSHDTSRTLTEHFWKAKPQCLACRHISRSTRQRAQQPGDDPNFMSIVDNPPTLVRAGRRHGPGLIILDWKSKLIAKFEDRLVRDPLPLPPHIDPTAINDFDYRRIYASGHFRHDQEMLIGPRMHDGNDGYLVITPLEREGKGTTVLVNRGWIPKKWKEQKSRPDGLPKGEVTVEGLLREPWKKNMFTPDNQPETKAFYFPDVEQMATLTGSQPVWIEETMEPDLLKAWDREARGIPIGRPGEVNLRNNHAQYIFTWYALAAATSVMLWMVIKKPPADMGRRVRQNKEWS
ncbi:Cytochrome oxidase assembly shy1 [Hyphodiscus hymeniophilus]|uniref:SURF1-like protein n=1 Tax=Hyphodiscus hymeniophilus TaxID=353542 RepID=A0A9P6VMD7_9HELO|nr:Cytochrome oxidase assembly shy1 [Hyphodiscus hymeniophilus]